MSTSPIKPTAQHVYQPPSSTMCVGVFHPWPDPSGWCSPSYKLVSKLHWLQTTNDYIIWIYEHIYIYMYIYIWYNPHRPNSYWSSVRYNWTWGRFNSVKTPGLDVDYRYTQQLCSGGDYLGHHPLSSGPDGVPHPGAVELPWLLTGPLCAAQHATALQSHGDSGGWCSWGCRILLPEKWVMMAMLVIFK